MVEWISTPDPHTLLPPLLACLPTSFASPRPPPALLSLLSPILRQRLQVHTSTSSTDNWAALLCWNAGQGEELKDTIEGATFEPHPSSGEIEVGEVGRVTYKRFDEETLKAQMPLLDWSMTAMYLWCSGGEEGSGWKLAELLPLDKTQQPDSSWLETIREADEVANERLVDEALREADAAGDRSRRTNLSVPPHEDDDYWAMYDRADGRTPNRKASVDLNANETSEDDYYARYGSVQPAMDNHDPDEEMHDAKDSTLNGGDLYQFVSSQLHNIPPNRDPPPYHTDVAAAAAEADPARVCEGDDDFKEVEVNQPVPSSPSSKGSETVARLEQHAERVGASEAGIRQHISTSLKSMYRLARSAGMDREEFERIVQRELEALSIFDRDD